MGLFTNTEKRIADAISQSFNLVKNEVATVEAAVVKEIGKIETALTADLKGTFDQARTDALSANALVNKLKADLQDALVKARDLHQIAVDAATAAQAAAEADAARFKALAAAHAADLATQAGQIVAAPAPAVDLAPAQ